MSRVNFSMVKRGVALLLSVQKEESVALSEETHDRGGVQIKKFLIAGACSSVHSATVKTHIRESKTHKKTHRKAQISSHFFPPPCITLRPKLRFLGPSITQHPLKKGVKT